MRRNPKIVSLDPPMQAAAGLMPNGAHELESNVALRFPWDSHVRRASDLPAQALQEAVAFDRHLWELAREDHAQAANECLDAQIHYRAGAPRLGEPVFRSEEYARNGWQNMSCGRGTGHLGTGLYFFGTLSAAYKSGATAVADELATLSDAELRERLASVWVVDVSAIPEDAVLYPSGERLGEWHSFARAMICLSDAEATLPEIEDERAQAEDRLRDLVEEDLVPNVSVEELERLIFTPDRRTVPVSDSELAEAEREVQRLVSREKSVYEDMRRWRRTIARDEPPVAASPAEAMRAYGQDVARRRFPGYHPMTYYMQMAGVDAIVQGDWAELNGGDVGCIWYPEVSS